MKRNLSRWVIEGENLRHNKAWSKDPDNLLCGWATKRPKNLFRRPDLKNWHCRKCRKRAPKEIQFAADLAFVKERSSFETFDTLGSMWTKLYTQQFVTAMPKFSQRYPLLTSIKASGGGTYFPIEKEEDEEE